MTVVEGLTQSGGTVTDKGGRDGKLSEISATDDLEILVLRCVQQDPFLTIAEIKNELKRHSLTNSVGWWKIFSILKKKGLLKMRSRFRYARGR